MRHSTNSTNVRGNCNDTSPTQFTRSTKLAIVAIAGEPNAGKSTLANMLLGCKHFATTPKAQTTRAYAERAITIGNTQLIFVDTPGIFQPKASNKLGRVITRNAWHGIKLAQHVLFLVNSAAICRLWSVQDELRAFIATQHDMIRRIGRDGDVHVTILFNKADLAGTYYKQIDVQTLASFAHAEFSELCADIMLVSALSTACIEKIVDACVANAQPGPWLYSDDANTNRDVSQKIAEQAILEQLYLQLRGNLPYTAKAEIDDWQEVANDSIKVYASIIVLRESQKQIIIGRHGSVIQSIGEQARLALSETLRRRVHLFLNVKVKKEWVNKLNDVF